MKAVILAAGKGTRMLPLTENTPKVLIKVAGKPFLYYLLKNIESAGIEDIAMIAGYRKEKINDFIDEYGFRIRLISQNKQLGTGHAIGLAREFTGDDDFLVLNGDNLVSADDIKAVMEKKGSLVSGIEHPEPSKFGVLKTEGSLLTDIVEKPKKFIGNLINTGIYRFTPEIYHALDKINISERGEYELTDAIRILAKENKVGFIQIRDYWKDLGCINNIVPIEKFIKNR